jgi:hypothetical protein
MHTHMRKNLPCFRPCLPVVPRRLAFSASLLVCALGAGCVYIKEPKLPAAWAAAMQRAPGTKADIAGTYVNDGSFSQFMANVLREELFTVPHPQVQLRLLDTRHLEVAARDGIQMLATRVLEVDSDPDTGIVVLKGDMKFGAAAGGAQMQGRKVRFVKGTDGYLYGEYIEYGGAAFLYVVPVVGSAGKWRRWAPVAP